MLKHFNVSEYSETLQQQIVVALENDGGCIVTELLTEEECDQLLNDFSPSLNEQNWGIDELGYRDEFYGNKTKRLHGLFSKSKRMESVLVHPTLISIGRACLVENEQALDLRLSNAELMVLGSDQSNQEFHADAGSWYRAQKMMRPNEILFSANIALTEFTETNGATRVVPGSHRWEHGRQPEEQDVCLAVMPKGSALLYTGNILHSGGANFEEEERVGLYMGYVVSWLRPIENHLITNTPEDINKMSPEAKVLLDVSPGGYTVIA